MDDAQKYDACVSALKEFAQNLHFTDVVIGLSGGLDSSLVAAMCVEAFSAEHVHGVLMPGPYSTDHSISDAQDLVQNLGIAAETISICEPFEAFEKVLGKACGGELNGLAAENTQARCRMVVLMALSNAHGWMVVNTGNKSEASMGYSTLYGDTVGAFAPLGGLYKTDVFAVSRWLNERALQAGEVAPIPQHVLDKPPSAELSAGQEDEKSLGVDYATLDAILVSFVEEGLSVDEIAQKGYDLEQVERIVRRYGAYAYKRALEPPYPEAKFYEGNC